MPRRSPLLTILVLSIPAAAVVALWFGRLGPARARAADLDDSLGAARLEAARAEPLKAERDALAAEQAAFGERLPTADEVRLDEIRRILTSYAAEAGVLLTGLAPERAEEDRGALPLEEFAFTIEARGGYATLARFVRLVETHRRLLRVEKLTLQPEAARPAETAEPQVTPLRLGLRLVTYAFR